MKASVARYPMARRLKEVIILKEKAAFWLDRNGFWHYEHERFRNRKIVHYFHSCIGKDVRGFYLAQRHKEYLEKAYFPYEDTALFVFDVIKGEDVILVLNTHKRIKLKPRRLFIRADSLYMHDSQGAIKFTEDTLVKVAPLLEFDGSECFIRAKGRRYRIAQA